MLIKFKGCELEFDRVCFYADVPRLGEVYLRRSPEARDGRWFERTSEGKSLQVHLGRTHIILCRPVQSTNGQEPPLAP
jgi:hypothetical protein